MTEHEELERRLLSDNWGTVTTSRLRLRRRDGTWAETWREAYDRGDAAAVLPCDRARGHVLLVRQFRWPAAYNGEADPTLVEVAAGLLDGDDPETCARREAREELGLDPAGLRALFTLYSAPGSVTERIHYFVADYGADAARAEIGGVAEEAEETEVLDLPFAAAMDMLADGRIRDAKTAILLQWAALNVFTGEVAA